MRGGGATAGGCRAESLSTRTSSGSGGALTLSSARAARPKRPRLAWKVAALIAFFFPRPRPNPQQQQPTLRAIVVIHHAPFERGSTCQRSNSKTQLLHRSRPCRATGPFLFFSFFFFSFHFQFWKVTASRGPCVALTGATQETKREKTHRPPSSPSQKGSLSTVRLRALTAESAARVHDAAFGRFRGRVWCGSVRRSRGQGPRLRARGLSRACRPLG